MLDPDVGPGGRVVLDDGESGGRPGEVGACEVVGETGALASVLTVPTDLGLLHLYPE